MRLILDIGVTGIIVLMMGAVGMEMEERHVRAVVRRKGSLLLTLAAQAMILPALGVGLACVLALPADLTAGLLLLAACPVGDIANVYTLLARGNVALSVTGNVLSILCAAGTMAAAFAAYSYFLATPFAFAAPTAPLLSRLLLLLILPVAAGSTLRRLAPDFAATHVKSVHGASAAGIVFLLGYVIVTQPVRLAAEWQQTALVAGTFLALALLAGFTFGWLLRLSQEDRLTVGIAFAVRNVALALAIAISVVNRVEYGVFAAVYFLTEVPLLLGVVAVARCHRPLAGPREGLAHVPR